MNIASIDIGTNTVLLLIAKADTNDILTLFLTYIKCLDWVKILLRIK
mgnify:CR=1 FL=1